MEEKCIKVLPFSSLDIEIKASSVG